MVDLRAAQSDQRRCPDGLRRRRLSARVRTSPRCEILTEIYGSLTDNLRDFGISDGYFRQPSRTVRASPSRARCTAPTPRLRSSCDCPRRAHRPRPSSSAQPPPPATAPTSGFRPSWLLGTTPGPSRIPWPIRSLRLSWRTSSNPHDHCRHLGCILPREYSCGQAANHHCGIESSARLECCRGGASWGCRRLARRRLRRKGRQHRVSSSRHVEDGSAGPYEIYSFHFEMK